MRLASSRCSAIARFSRRGGFSILEVLVATTVIAMLLGILVAAFNQTLSTFRQTSLKISSFQTARVAFDLMTKTLSQATLNTYWDYYDASGKRRTASNAQTFAPAAYGRASDLPFLVQRNAKYGQSAFFAAPEMRDRSPQKQDTQGLLNLCSFAVRFGSDQSFRPSAYTGSASYRYRLMHAVQPRSDGAAIFSHSGADWISAVTAKELPIATNVIALVVWPRLTVFDQATASNNATLSADYLYSSLDGTARQQAQLPPVLQVTIVAIDEESASRISQGETPPPAIENALENKFQDVTKYDKDLKDLETALAAAKIKYEVFSTAIPIRESKWSE